MAKWKKIDNDQAKDIWVQHTEIENYKRFAVNQYKRESKLWFDSDPSEEELTKFQASDSFWNDILDLIAYGFGNAQHRTITIIKEGKIFETWQK